MTHRTPLSQNRPAEAPSTPKPLRRCLTCQYVISHLPQNACPECGRAFDPHDPATFSTGPKSRTWLVWLIGVVLPFVLGSISYFLLLAPLGPEISLAAAVLIASGAILGYRGVRWLQRLALNLAVLLAVLSLAAIMGSATVLDILPNLAMATGPLLIGCGAGAWLRVTLNRWRWDRQTRVVRILIVLQPLVATVIGFT